MRSSKLLNAVAALIVACPIVSTCAYAEAVQYDLKIAPQPLSAALQEFAKQSGVQIIFFSTVTDGYDAPPLSGKYTASDALQLLLNHSELTFREINAKTIEVQPKAPANSLKKSVSFTSPAATTDAGDSIRLAQASGGQTSSAASEVEARNTIQEVIVTATKRAESVQKVPASITAFSQENLERMGADSFSDFALQVPGLHMTDTGPNGSQFVIRGIAPLGADTQDTVVPYIDDLPTTDSSANITTPDMRLFDVERVEVLRGPQGTLFGSGAMGGAIRIITNKPNFSARAAKIELGMEQTEGGALSTSYNAMINEPFADGRVALRAVGYYRDEGGWLDTTGQPGVAGGIQGSEKNANSETAYGGRVMLRFKPVEQMDVLARLSYQKSEPEGRAYYTLVEGDTRVQQRAINDYYFEEAAIANLVINYDFGPVSLMSSSTYYDHDGGRVEDFSGFSIFLFPDLRASQFIQSAPSKSVFQEMRLSSNGDGPLSWLAGVYYRDQYERQILNRFRIPGSEALLGSGINGAPGDIAWSLDGDFKTIEKAVFGEVNYQLTERLVGTVGLRRFENSIKTHSVQSGGLFYPDGPSLVQLDSKDESTTYKFSLAYSLFEKTMLYLTAAEGYRVGNANLVPLGEAGTVPASYGPDSLWNYELGTKSTVLDGRLVLNAAVYYIDWSDMQIGTENEAGTGYIGNVGKAHSQGAEFEINALLGRSFEYTAAASYTDARIDVDNEGLGVRSGDRIPRTTKVMFSNILRSSFTLGGHASYVQASHQYVGKSYTDLDQSECFGPCTSMGGYNMVGLRSGMFLGNWEVAAFINNVFDDDSITNVYPIAGGTRYYPVTPRTFGLTVRADF
ncbi:TonB-dependent receptor domain-containing protein [Steroidobacter sp.]|uniref:TonB-dependent receptor domain-containing protein n=1 Tax=Steroidobacter sp. TaxID=1978227 RepID=UPI001A3EEC70|nr:TonB-dependent receptor [Steroidobacter sp.]MBL8268872.1 TonB-dependent receptor [Steroidobacter sp.]